MAEYRKSARKKTPGPVPESYQYYFDVLDRVSGRTHATAAHVPRKEKLDISQEIAREQKIKNDNAEQDIALKRRTLTLLFLFLGIETALVFLFTFWQATDQDHFHLEEWSFRTLVGATILQITGMLLAAVRYLFPKVRR